MKLFHQPNTFNNTESPYIFISATSESLPSEELPADHPSNYDSD